MANATSQIRSTRSPIVRLLKTNELGVLIALLTLGLILSLTTRNLFLNTDNLLKVARQASPYGIMAVGMVFVLVLGEVDLSVGSIYVLANIVMALALRAHAPVGLALLAGLATGISC